MGLTEAPTARIAVTLKLRQLGQVNADIHRTARARHDAWRGREDTVALDKTLAALYVEKRRVTAKLEQMRPADA